jgi:hypothetical protein
MIGEPIEQATLSTDATSPFAAPEEFSFRSYGVNIRVESSDPNLLEEAERVTRKALIGRILPAGDAAPESIFRIEINSEGYFVLYQNGKYLSMGPSRKGFFKFFDSIIRVAVARDAVDHVFMHAGVVGWREKAIVIPGDSFQGKSTLVAELVRNGAVYYSDEFAIFDSEGLVHPFQRPLAMRTDDGEFTTYELTVESLGGVSGNAPIPVGMVLLTKYKQGDIWKPKMLSPGNGVLEMIPFTISLGNQPEFALLVLKNIAGRAIIASSSRGSAKEFAKILLNFVDKNVN